MKILSNRLLVSSIVIAAVFATTAYAKSIFDIEYPIAELGGCTDKTSCKAYCDAPENQEACDNFAASYGIEKAKKRVEERAQRKEFAMKDGGPGNCAANSNNPEESCRTYCDSPENLSECVAYGKSRGLLKGRGLEEAERVVKALASGVALPEGCTSAESCKQTCDEPKNVGVARACFTFAEKAGILPPDIDREKAEKVFKLIEEGKAPFRSPKDFRQCENPASDEIMEKCIKFGEENDLIPPKDLEMIKKTGGKGPGGCRGKEQCDAYCSENQEECVKFAEEHNLISPEDKVRMQEGLTRFREEIMRVPSEVKQCLESAVGADRFAQMVAGTQNPTREFGDTMRTCFESVFGPPRFEPGIRVGEFPPRESGFPGMMPPQGEGVGMPFGPDGSTSSFRGGAPFTQGRPQQGGMFPPQVEECVKGKVGSNALRELGTAQIDREGALGQAISACMREVEGPHEEGFFQGRGEGQPYRAPQFDGGQGTSSRIFQPRPGERFDPQSLINPQAYGEPTMDPRIQQGMPHDGQMPPPPGAPQIQPYSLESHESMVMPPQEVVNVVSEPAPIVEPVH